MAAAGKIAVLKIDVQGAMAAMKRVPQAISIFLMPPSLEELRRRLVHRGTDTLEQIETRMKNAATEMEAAGEYNFVVINDSVERAVEEIDRLVCGK
jgi:guanylate kinase